ncbi:MAG: UMP kinase [Rhodomicrobiaceae bacterium]
MAANPPRIPLYKRALLKLSGEALLGGRAYGIDPEAAARIAREIDAARRGGTEICVVIGGGNIFRGLAGAAGGMDRVKADYIGMLATVMNAVALGNALDRAGCPAVIHSAIPVEAVAERFQRDKAVADLGSGRIVIFAGGTGNPFFTTDTTAALRAAEMGCDVILKATQVDGIYSADPKIHADAVRYERLTYDEALHRDLKVMDGAAFALARDAGIPILVFSCEAEGSIARVLAGEGLSSLVTAGSA